MVTTARSEPEGPEATDSQRSVLRLSARADYLPITLRLAKHLSNDALFEFCQENRELRIERTAQGELLIMSPTGGETGRRNFTLVTLFGSWCARDARGIGFDSSTGFVLPNGAERSPDMAWVRRERWENLPRAARIKFLPLCPDFVVEIKSPTDTIARLIEKMHEYRDCGASLGWLIDADDRRVYVVRPNVVDEVLDDPDALDGGDLLPGFSLSMANIW